MYNTLSIETMKQFNWTKRVGFFTFRSLFSTTSPKLIPWGRRLEMSKFPGGKERKVSKWQRNYRIIIDTALDRSRYTQDAHFIEERVSQRAFPSLPPPGSTLSFQCTPLIYRRALELYAARTSFHRGPTPCRGLPPCVYSPPPPPPLHHSFCLHAARFRHRRAYAPRLSPRQRTRERGPPLTPCSGPRRRNAARL